VEKNKPNFNPLLSEFNMADNKIESGEILQLIMAIVSVVLILSLWTAVTSQHI